MKKITSSQLSLGSKISCVLLSAVAFVASAPAQAQSIRTYVSISGSDSNPCSLTAPCRHFQAAVNATSVGGEVDALDPGGYGSLTIMQAVTIDGQGWSYVAPASGGNGITINASSGAVVIRGVSINGVGTTGTNGIVFNSGGGLVVNNCVVDNFVGSETTGNGILIAPTSAPVSGSTVVAFSIENTIVGGNAYAGIYYRPPSGSFTAIGTIDHVVANGNQFGIGVYMVLASGGFASVSINNSVASNNFADGIVVSNSGSSASISLALDNTSAVNNLYGLYATGSPYVVLGRSALTQNEYYGVYNNTSSSTVFSFGNNDLSWNGPLGGSGNATLNPLTNLTPQ
jgi:hypothetical protein